MTHDAVWYSRPRKFGKGSRGWWVVHLLPLTSVWLKPLQLAGYVRTKRVSFVNTVSTSAVNVSEKNQPPLDSRRWFYITYFVWILTNGRSKNRWNNIKMAIHVFTCKIRHGCYVQAVLKTCIFLCRLWIYIFSHKSFTTRNQTVSSPYPKKPNSNDINKFIQMRLNKYRVTDNSPATTYYKTDNRVLGSMKIACTTVGW